MSTAQPSGFQVTPTFIMCLRGPRKLKSGKRSKIELGNGREGERLVNEIENRRLKYIPIEKPGYYLTGRKHNQP
jgi:hypothetical protein